MLSPPENTSTIIQSKTVAVPPCVVKCVLEARGQMHWIEGFDCDNVFVMETHLFCVRYIRAELSKNFSLHLAKFQRSLVCNVASATVANHRISTRQRRYSAQRGNRVHWAQRRGTTLWRHFRRRSHAWLPNAELSCSMADTLTVNGSGLQIHFQGCFAQLSSAKTWDRPLYHAFPRNFQVP